MQSRVHPFVSAARDNKYLIKFKTFIGLPKIATYIFYVFSVAKALAGKAENILCQAQGHALRVN